DPGNGGAVRRGQAHGVARPEDPTLPLAALLRGGGVHRRPREVRRARGQRPGVPRDCRRQARRPAGAGLLHGRRDRRGRGEGQVVARVEAPAMADRLRLEVGTPTRVVVSGDADEVVIPGVEGAFGVLPGHAALLSLVGTGEVMYRAGREEHYLAVSGGFA